MKAFICNNLQSTIWTVGVYEPSDSTESYSSDTLEDAIAHCDRNNIEYQVIDWRNGFEPERGYSSTRYRDELQYLYEVAP